MVCDGQVSVFQRDIYSGTIARWPDPVRKISHWNGSHQFRGTASPEGLDFIRSTDRDVGKLAIPILCEVHVIGDGTGIEQRLPFERRRRAEYLRLAHIFKSDPDFVVFRTDGDVGTERTRLRQALENLLRSRGHNCQPTSKAGRLKARA